MNNKEITIISEEELLKSKCRHMEKGTVHLVEVADTKVNCDICEETFRIIVDQKEADKIADDFLSLLQSIKTCYLDIPREYLDEFSSIIPLIKRTPILFAMAMNNFSKYEEESGSNCMNTNMKKMPNSKEVLIKDDKINIINVIKEKDVVPYFSINDYTFIVEEDDRKIYIYLDSDTVKMKYISSIPYTDNVNIHLLETLLKEYKIIPKNAIVTWDNGGK